MNYAVILIPDFPLQAIQRGNPALARKPVALVDGDGRKAMIAYASPEAHGIERGMAVTIALSRCSGLKLEPRDPTLENDLQRLCVAAAFGLSPRVENTDDGCCTVDLQGTGEGDPEARLRRCAAELRAAGVGSRVGCGATPLLAMYAARCADSVLVVRDGRAFLGPLPVDAAEPSEKQKAILLGWGIHTLAQLTALSKADVAQRMGTDGAALWDRAAGEAVRVLRLIEPGVVFATEWEYEPPIDSMEPLLFRLRRYAEVLALELRGAGKVASKLSLTLLLEDETDYHRDFALPEPSTAVETWMRVFLAHLEAVRTEARVVGVRLVATPTRPLVKQDGLWDSGLKDPAAFFENLAKIAAIVGDDRVGTPVPMDTWRPDAVRLEKPDDVVAAPEGPPVHPLRGLTLRRFRPAWAAVVEINQGQPMAFAANGVTGTVVDRCGPFRLSGDWWRHDGSWECESWYAELSNGAVYQLTLTSRGWVVDGTLD